MTAPRATANVNNTGDNGDNKGLPPVPPVENNSKKIKSILKNTAGKEVPEKDYFYSTKSKDGTAPDTFTKMCGYPVDREDLVEVFDRIFKPEDNFLFYKSGNKEVYLVIVPLKYSTTVGNTHESIDGDFQKHAMSFINEGSVNLETLKMKLTRVLGFVDFDKR